MDVIPATGNQAWVNFISIPTAALIMEGNPSTIDGGQFVAKVLAIQNGNVNINYAMGNNAQPVSPRLAE